MGSGAAAQPLLPNKRFDRSAIEGKVVEMHITANDLADELEDTARWRADKAAQHPHDTRNAQSVAQLTDLAMKMRAIDENSEPLRVFNAFWRVVVMDEDNGLEYSRGSSEYRARVGFGNFPDTPEEYLRDLMGLLRDPIANQMVG